MGNNERMGVTILGSGTCVPSLARHACSVLVSGGGLNVLVDAGPGTMSQLLKLGVGIDDIDVILLSHFHLDHCAELAPFIFATKYPGFDRVKPLTLGGGTGIRQLFDRLNTAYGKTLEMPDDLLHILELEEKGQAQWGPAFKAEYAQTVHNPESRAFRFTGSSGDSLVYSGDTDYSEELIRLSHGADILICESALPDSQKAKGHLTPSLAGKIAAKARVKHLVLTHFYPECDAVDIRAECRKTWSGPLTLARDLMRLEI